MPENQTSVLPLFTDMLICAFTVACYKFRLCHTAGQKKSKCLDVNTVTAELLKFHSFGTAVPVPPLCSVPVIVTAPWLWEPVEPVNLRFFEKSVFRLHFAARASQGHKEADRSKKFITVSFIL